MKYPTSRPSRCTTPAGDAGSAFLLPTGSVGNSVAKPRGASRVPGPSIELEPQSDSIPDSARWADCGRAAYGQRTYGSGVPPSVIQVIVSGEDDTKLKSRS